MRKRIALGLLAVVLVAAFASYSLSSPSSGMMENTRHNGDLSLHDGRGSRDSGEREGRNDDLRHEFRHDKDDIDEIRGNVVRNQFSLTPSMSDMNGSGIAEIKASLDKNSDIVRVTIELRVSDLQMPSDHVLEAWLVDRDTGFKLSLGAFTTNPDRSGKMKFRENLVNFDIYDSLVVTSEPVRDTDPNPSMEILSADIAMPISNNLFNMRADLQPSEEVPSVSSSARGMGTFILDTQQKTLTFNIEFSGLQGTETGAHIHGPAERGQNADILFTLPAGNEKTGVWHYDPALENDIFEGRTYVNIHSNAFPDGEIRGQIRIV